MPRMHLGSMAIGGHDQNPDLVCAKNPLGLLKASKDFLRSIKAILRLSRPARGRDQFMRDKLSFEYRDTLKWHRWAKYWEPRGTTQAADQRRAS